MFAQPFIPASSAPPETSRDIAKMLDISADAVKQHLAAICTKLGAGNRVEAIAIAMRRHIV